MNIVVWIIQILLAVHTLIGAVWKFMNSEQAVPSLNTIPTVVWQGIGVVELFFAAWLILPLINRTRYGKMPTVAGLGIALVMFFYCGVHLFSGSADRQPLIYWLLVAAVSLFVAYARRALKPHKAN